VFLYKQARDKAKAKKGEPQRPILQFERSDESVETIHSLKGGQPSSPSVEQWSEAVKTTASDGWLPLHSACKYTAPFHVIRFLVEQWPEGVGMANSDGDLPLHVACAKKTPLEVIRYVVAQWEAALYTSNKAGHFPLHLACSNRPTLEVVEFLVGQWEAVVRMTTANGRLPLHFACKYTASLEVVKSLVEQWPDAVRITDSFGRTPLDYAITPTAGRPMPEVVSWLRAIADSLPTVAITSKQQSASTPGEPVDESKPKPSSSKTASTAKMEDTQTSPPTEEPARDQAVEDNARVPPSKKTNKTVLFGTRAELESAITNCKDAIQKADSSHDEHVIDSAILSQEYLKKLVPLRDTLPSAKDLKSRIHRLDLELDQLGRESLKEKRELAVKTKELKMLLEREEKAEQALREPMEMQSSNDDADIMVGQWEAMTAPNELLPSHTACTNQGPLEGATYFAEQWPDAIEKSDSFGRTPSDYPGAITPTDGRPRVEVVSCLQAEADGRTTGAISPEQQSTSSPGEPESPYNKTSVFGTRVELEAIIAKYEDAIRKADSSLDEDVFDSAMHAEEQLETILPLRDILPCAKELQSQIHQLGLELEQGSLIEKKERAVKMKGLKRLLAQEEQALREPTEIQNSSDAIEVLVEQWEATKKLVAVNRRRPPHFAWTADTQPEVAEQWPEAVKVTDSFGRTPLEYTITPTNGRSFGRTPLEYAITPTNGPLEYAITPTNGRPKVEVVSCLQAEADGRTTGAISPEQLSTPSPGESVDEYKPKPSHSNTASRAKMEDAQTSPVMEGPAGDEPEQEYALVASNTATVFGTRAELESAIAKYQDAIERGVFSHDEDVIDSAMHAVEHLIKLKPLRDTLPSAKDLQSQIQLIELQFESLGRESFQEKKALAVKINKLKRLRAWEENAEQALREPTEIQISSDALHTALVANMSKPAVALSLSFLNKCTDSFNSHSLLGTGGFAEVYRGLDVVKGINFAVKRFFPQVLQGANAAFTRDRINEEITVSRYS
jgi:hypothetical protein